MYTYIYTYIQVYVWKTVKTVLETLAADLGSETEHPAALAVDVPAGGGDHGHVVGVHADAARAAAPVQSTGSNAGKIRPLYTVQLEEYQPTRSGEEERDKRVIALFLPSSLSRFILCR